MLTPYQFASDRPIDGVDLDGLEFSKATLDGLRKKIAVLQNSAGVVLAPMSHGTLNGIADANSFGISDHLPKFTGLNTNNINQYTGIEQVSYLVGRALGATIALEQAGVEIGAGGGLSMTGAGAVVGGPLAIHGGSVGLAAASDLTWALAKLLTLNIDLTDNSTGSNTTDGTSSQNNDAHGSSSASDANSAKAKDLKLGHNEETITKSADYKKIKNMSDEELKESVLHPKNYDPVTINTKTGKLADGNTRIYEINRRGLDVDVPLKKYTPDDSAFPTLKEPPVKKIP